jgi:CRISPR/Cas system CSM-associated protein Csm3 (group 7 of RAMP superfamily)
MMLERLNRQYQRHIVKRIIVRGTLILDTPTCLSSGDSDDLIDLMLVRDSLEDKALLTGASIAGALRNYLREYGGYNALDESQLFGCQWDEQDGEQSPLIVYDSISSDNLKAELRDGVKIKSTTGTAEKGAKYDLELLEAGTKFNICFELLIDGQDKNENVLIRELAIALSGLEKGEISLGMKKRRGFGRCHVEKWQVWNFNLEDTSDRISWLNFAHWQIGLLPNHPTYPLIKEAFENVGIPFDINREDKRDRFLIHATFKLVGSLLIRSGQDSTGRAPDAVHLKSHRPDKPEPQHVLSGTSLAGVLRHRAERIVKTLGSCSPIVDKLFGFVVGKQSQASRLVVHEKVIEKATDLVQNRIAIDRFTGGAYHGALFDEQPIFGGDQTIVTIELELRNPKEYEIGLLLLLLKDLWTQDLPVGGESSIGRGRLKGIKTDLIWHHPQNPKQWRITQSNGNLKIEDISDSSKPENLVKDELEKFVKVLLKELGKEV